MSSCLGTRFCKSDLLFVSRLKLLRVGKTLIYERNASNSHWEQVASFDVVSRMVQIISDTKIVYHISTNWVNEGNIITYLYDIFFDKIISLLYWLLREAKQFVGHGGDRFF